MQDYKKVKLTLTDLAQSESSLAGANANLIKAKQNYKHPNQILKELLEKNSRIFWLNEKIILFYLIL